MAVGCRRGPFAFGFGFVRVPCLQVDYVNTLAMTQHMGRFPKYSCLGALPFPHVLVEHHLVDAQRQIEQGDFASECGELSCLWLTPHNGDSLGVAALDPPIRQRPDHKSEPRRVHVAKTPWCIRRIWMSSPPDRLPPLSPDELDSFEAPCSAMMSQCGFECNSS